MSQNPYQATGAASGYATMADMATTDARAIFIKRTYLHLLGAILLCIAIDAVILTVFHEQLGKWVGFMFSGWNSLIFFGAFMGVSYMAERWAYSGVSRKMQYTGLAVYVFAQAIFLAPMLYFAEIQGGQNGSGAIQSAGIVTAIVFGGLTLTVLLTKADFSFLRWGLTAGGFIAFGLIGASVLMGGFSLGLWFSVAMVIFACGTILYSTSNVLHRYNTDQYVAASLSLFASVSLLFWYVLRIFMSSD